MPKPPQEVSYWRDTPTINLASGKWPLVQGLFVRSLYKLEFVGLEQLVVAAV